MNVNRSFEKSLYHSLIKPLGTSLLYRKQLNDIETCVLFIGNSRSGTTLIASLLDAHREIVISHELSLLKYVKTKLGPHFLMSKIISKSQYFKQKGSTWQSFNYKIENSGQGKFKHLKVIGDKKAHQTTRLLIQEPELLSTLEEKIERPLKLIHVIRNPFDAIATKARRGSKNKIQPTTFQLQRETQIYFENIDYIQNQIPSDLSINSIRFEEFISNPKSSLIQLLEFLEVRPSDEYLEACLQLIKPTYNRSREEIDYPEDVRNTIKEKINQYPILSGYTFEK